MSLESEWRVRLPVGSGFRPLTATERCRVFRRLRKRWPQPDEDWWHPLTTFATKAGSIRLQASWLTAEMPLAEFRRRAARRWSRFWAIGEGSPTWDDLTPSFQGEFEISAAYLSPVTANEMIVMPTSLDWLAYTDHNDSVCLVGEWLVDTVKQLWPTWERHIWTTPFYAQPSHSHQRTCPWWEFGSDEPV